MDESDTPPDTSDLDTSTSPDTRPDVGRPGNLAEIPSPRAASLEVEKPAKPVPKSRVLLPPRGGM